MAATNAPTTGGTREIGPNHLQGYPLRIYLRQTTVLLNKRQLCPHRDDATDCPAISEPRARPNPPQRDIMRPAWAVEVLTITAKYTGLKIDCGMSKMIPIRG